jgi:hypothetical protein
MSHHVAQSTGAVMAMSVISEARLRLALAIILAPLAPGVILLLVSLCMRQRLPLESLLSVSVISYIGMLVLGLPIHLLLIARRWIRVWSYMLAGFLAGVFVVAGIVAMVFGFHSGAAQSWSHGRMRFRPSRCWRSDLAHCPP